jgi:5-methylcytosine-specific restriction endonuclease McrA
MPSLNIELELTDSQLNALNQVTAKRGKDAAAYLAERMMSVIVGMERSVSGKKIKALGIYERFVKVSLDEVLPCIVNLPELEQLLLKDRKEFTPEEKKKFKELRKPVYANFGDYEVKVSSLRLRTFKEHGLKCACCGLEASFFAIERARSDKKATRPHLNLYAINENGDEVLMTHDHIHPRSKGGANLLSNTQTMCKKCNHKKGDKVQITLVDPEEDAAA